MAEKTLNTRILLKYDTYTNWMTNNPILKAGEVAIATITSGNTQEVNSVAAPQVLLKVGDGTTAYNSLKFVSGLAADVYSWAKAASKPSYTANEISGLSDYISGAIQDTDTQYKIVKVDDYNYKLQSKTLNGSWADVTGGTITIPKYDDTQVKADISAIKDGSTIDSFADVETALAGKQAAGDYATKAQAKAYADAKDTAISAAKSAADAAQADVDALETTVTTLIGSDTGKTARSIAAEETAKIVAGADESYNTLKEIADWISSHTTDAASMNSKINTNAANITALDNSLATIAKTGNVNDLVQTSGDVLIFDCGNSTI